MDPMIGYSRHDLLAGYDDDDAGSIGGDGTTEIVGADDLDVLLGADDLDLLMGAAAPQRQRPAAVMHRARQIDPNAVAVIQRRLSTRRKFPLGFPVVAIPAGGSALLETNPQFVFRPERLVVPSDIAFDIRLQDVKVGTQSQFVSTDPVPAAVFSEVAINTGISFKTAEIGNGVSFTAINIAAQQTLFSAAIIGTSVTAGT
jgi:hypothetical protein